MPTTQPAASSRTAALLAAAALTATALPAQEGQYDTSGLPTFLLPVPGGKVWMGLDHDQLMRVACEAVYPSNPDQAVKIKRANVERALKNCVFELGREQIDVEAYLLGRWPVTNREYLAYLEAMKALGQKVKPPFHWWRWGREDDYNERIEAISREFPGEGAMGPQLYWERHGEDLPYRLQNKSGEDISDHPVTWVSHRDAVRFAGWLGMRLPTEAERTRAARGDGEHLWPWGTDEEFGDHYVEAVKKKLGLGHSSDVHLKRVGAVPYLKGPYGHLDMTGQIWEFVAGRGFRPLCSYGAFEREWKQLMRDKIAAELVSPPLWKDHNVIAKGGSYLSGQDPIQFHIDSRTPPLQTVEVQPSLGYRLAKSLKPGYDILFSLVSSDYNRDVFAPDQDVDLVGQIGVERYVLGADGFPVSYHAVSFAPLNFVTADKNLRGRKLEEHSQSTPIPLGTLVLTEKALQPKLGKGIYTVAWRGEGMSRELVNAIKQGHKEVQTALRRRAQGGKEKEGEAAPEEELEIKQGDWQAVLKRYGLTPEDLEAKDAPSTLKMIRLGGLEVPTDRNVFLFWSNEGKWVAHAPAGGLADHKNGEPTAVLGEKQIEKARHAMVGFTASMPLLQGDRRRIEYRLEIVLEQGPPKPDEAWRVPASMPAGAGGSNNRLQGR